MCTDYDSYILFYHIKPVFLLSIKKFLSTMYIYHIKGTHFSAWYYVTFSKIATCVGFLKIHHFNYRYTILSHWLQSYIWEIHCACKFEPKIAKSNFQKNNPHSIREVTLFVSIFFFAMQFLPLANWLAVSKLQ